VSTEFLTILKNREELINFMKKFLIIFAVLAGLNTYAISPNDPLPSKILRCGGGVIAEIAGRLEGDTNLETGAHVFLNNGGVTVSYQEDISLTAIRNSKVGDHVLVCLVFIPKDCPKGDTRGKIYTITNLRTLESWTLPDSQHSCGGA
jgi:hypothetical protein